MHKMQERIDTEKRYREREREMTMRRAVRRGMSSEEIHKERER